MRETFYEIVKAPQAISMPKKTDNKNLPISVINQAFFNPARSTIETVMSFNVKTDARAVFLMETDGAEDNASSAIGRPITLNSAETAIPNPGDDLFQNVGRDGANPSHPHSTVIETGINMINFKQRQRQLGRNQMPD